MAKKGRPKMVMTEKEEQIMKMLWSNGPLFVREMVALYPEPQPHFNTVSTLVRILEQKGHVGHEVVNGSHRFFAITQLENVRKSRFSSFVKDYFSNSYMSAVSALVKEEKISADELRELLDMVEKQSGENK